MFYFTVTLRSELSEPLKASVHRTTLDRVDYISAFYFLLFLSWEKKIEREKKVKKFRGSDL